MDGTNESTIIEIDYALESFTIDNVYNMIYWINIANDTIERCDFDGNRRETFSGPKDISFEKLVGKSYVKMLEYKLYDTEWCTIRIFFFFQNKSKLLLTIDQFDDKLIVTIITWANSYTINNNTFQFQVEATNNFKIINLKSYNDLKTFGENNIDTFSVIYDLKYVVRAHIINNSVKHRVCQFFVILLATLMISIQQVLLKWVA